MCRIDKLMQMVCKIGYVKQKKYVFSCKIDRKLRRIDVNDLKKKNKKKSTESVGACQVHMEKVSKDKMQQRLVDKEQPDVDT